MKITAAQVMSRDVLTVGSDWSVERLADFLVDHAITGAPVVTDDGTPVGVVSLTDLARSSGAWSTRVGDVPADYYRNALERRVAREEVRSFRVDDNGEATVRDIMTPMVFDVQEDTSVQEVAEAMITGRIHRVFVTNGGKMVGVISSMDLLPLVRDM